MLGAEVVDPDEFEPLERAHGLEHPRNLLPVSPRYKHASLDADALDESADVHIPLDRVHERVEGVEASQAWLGVEQGPREGVAARVDAAEAGEETMRG